MKVKVLWEVKDIVTGQGNRVPRDWTYKSGDRQWRSSRRWRGTGGNERWYLGSGGLQDLDKVG